MEPQSATTVIAESKAMRQLLETADRVAQAKSPVLLQGESGTGKDLLAHWIHNRGERSDGPLIKVHCPSIPSDLLESELFGYERGAFTDARAAKAGKIQLAEGGTLYFDQIQDLTPALQAKLLRVVEERRYERLGGTRTLQADVRFLSAANVDLRQAITSGLFREDLYHRLSVVPLLVPPLRERREDIVPLAELFLRREGERRPHVPVRFEAETLTVLRGYSWPGNVRELRAAIERAALCAEGPSVRPEALPAHVREQPSTLWAGRDRQPSLQQIEEAYIRYILEQTRGRQTRAAAILGISRKSLWEKRRRYGIP